MLGHIRHELEVVAAAAKETSLFDISWHRHAIECGELSPLSRTPSENGVTEEVNASSSKYGFLWRKVELTSA